MRHDAVTGFAELVAASNYSFLRGASHPAELVARAAELGLDALGIADRNTLAGVVRAHAAAKEAGLRLIVGARLVTQDGFEAVCHPSDRTAYGRLCRLLTAGNRRAEKGDCRFTFAELLDAAAGQLFILPPPEAPDDAFAERARALAAAAPESVHLAAVHRYRGDERRRLAELETLAEALGTPLIASNDVLYHAPERRPLADVLTCIREHCTIQDAGFRLEANAERHLKAPAEMARLFRDHPQAIARARALADRARFSLEALRYEYPDEPVPPGKTPQQHLEELTFATAATRYPQGVPAEVAALLRKELALIAQLDYARYFLTVHDVVAFARGQGILCQGRGSAANSAVCYCLGITAVDPTRIALLFERFISAERREPPDIDVDFEHERREEVIQYLYRRYGRARAAICATVIHYRPKSALREVGKAMGLAEDMVAALASSVWGWGRDGVAAAHIRAAGFDPDNPALAQALDLARALIGFPRHLSQHVGGFILTRERLDETVPIGNGAMQDRTFIEWDKDDIDALGILKVDVLALGMLTAIKRALGFLRDHHGVAFGSIAEVPAEDPAVYEMLARADSVGVFQVESRAQMSMLPRLRPRNFYDLVIEVAIVRPGPIQGDMVHPYLRRRDGLEPVDYPSPALRAVLEKTYGVPLFQEQAMQIAIVAAGFTPGEADKLRRAMATFRHAGTIHGFRDKFIAGMGANGYARDFAERCFKQIEGFGDYGFPESHAASFALLVYVSAWIKCHYPDAFCAALLNSQPMGFYQPAQLVRDARAHGVEVRPPDVNFSDWDCTLEETHPLPSWERVGGGGEAPLTARASGVGGAAGCEGRNKPLRLGLRLIAGLSEADGRAIVAARGAGYDSVDAVWRRSGVSRAVLRRLAGADAFGSLGLDRRQALWAAKGLDRGVLEGDTPPPHDPFPEPAVALPLMPLGAEVAEDYQATGLSLKAHPLTFLRSGLEQRGVLTTEQQREARRAGTRVALAGLVLVRQRPGTAKGVVFLTLEDECGSANVIVWRRVFEDNRRAVMNARLLLVRGTLQREGLVIHIVAESFEDLSAELARLPAGEEIPAPHERPQQLALPRSRDFH